MIPPKFDLVNQVCCGYPQEQEMLEGTNIPESSSNVGMLMKAEPTGLTKRLADSWQVRESPLGSQSGPFPSRMLGLCFFGSPVLLI